MKFKKIKFQGGKRENEKSQWWTRKIRPTQSPDQVEGRNNHHCSALENATFSLEKECARNVEISDWGHKWHKSHCGHYGFLKLGRVAKGHIESKDDYSEEDREAGVCGVLWYINRYKEHSEHNALFAHSFPDPHLHGLYQFSISQQVWSYTNVNLTISFPFLNLFNGIY